MCCCSVFWVAQTVASGSVGILTGRECVIVCSVEGVVIVLVLDSAELSCSLGVQGGRGGWELLKPSASVLQEMASALLVAIVST